MRYLLAILSLVAAGLIGTAYAEPLDEVDTTVIDVYDSKANVEISWNHDSSASRYEVGCVSCIPNLSESTVDDQITLQNITALDDGRALLYIVVYNDSDEIISGKQIILQIQ